MHKRFHINLDRVLKCDNSNGQRMVTMQTAYQQTVELQVSSRVYKLFEQRLEKYNANGGNIIIIKQIKKNVSD